VQGLVITALGLQGLAHLYYSFQKTDYLNAGIGKLFKHKKRRSEKSASITYNHYEKDYLNIIVA
jgi:hypothetical protein